MSDKIKQLAPQIWSEIQKANKILLCLHPRPDLDSVASNLAMAAFLKKLNKTITIISGDDNKPPDLAFLPGWEGIKNNHIGEIDLKKFDLFISMDAGGIGRISSKNNLQSPLPVKTVVIDHHPDNLGFGNINLIDSEAHSTCEILWTLFETWDKSYIDTNIAICIYIGMWGDTMGFVSATKRTLGVLTKCMEFNIDPPSINNKLTQMPHRQVIIMGKILSASKLLFNNSLVMSKITFAEFIEANIHPEEIGQCKESSLYQLRRTMESSISILIYEYDPGWISISMRSDIPEKYNVSKIANELGGGGHSFAASAKFNGSIDEAEELVIQTIQKVYPELGQP